MDNRRIFPAFPRLSIGHILAAALLLRVVFILLATGLPLDDAGYYFSAGQDLAAGKGYLLYERPTAYWPVGYPFFLSILFRFFGPHLILTRIIQALLSCGIIGLAYLLARKAHGERAGLAAAALLALMPSQIAFPFLLYSEILFTALSLAGFYLLTSAGAGRNALAGLGFGLACYVRPEALLFPLLGLAATRDIPWRTRAVRLLVLYLVIGAVTAPWALRNSRLFQQPVWMSTNFGINLWMGNHDGATGGYRVTPEMEQALHRSSNEADFDRLARRQGLDFIRHNPGRFLRLTVSKMRILWGQDMEAVRGSFMRTSPQTVGVGIKALMAVSQLYYLALGLLALAGVMVIFRRKEARYRLPFLIILYYTILYTITTASTRYHFFGIIGLALLAASAASRNEPGSISEAAASFPPPGRRP